MLVLKAKKTNFIEIIIEKNAISDISWFWMLNIWKYLLKNWIDGNLKMKNIVSF